MKERTPVLVIAAFALGLLMLAAGLTWLSPPVALVVFGALLLAVALFHDPAGGDE